MLLSVLAHHGEPGDPQLMEWIMHQLNAMLGVGPAAMAIGLGILIVAIPRRGLLPPEGPRGLLPPEGPPQAVKGIPSTTGPRLYRQPTLGRHAPSLPR